MQFIELIIVAFRRIFFRSQFTKKYRTKSKKFLIKILKNPKKLEKYQILDIRNFIDYKYSHLIYSTNIPAIDDGYSVFKKIDRNKKTLIISENYRSHLNFYRFLISKRLKPSILLVSFTNEVRNDEQFKEYIYISQKDL